MKKGTFTIAALTFMLSQSAYAHPFGQIMDRLDEDGDGLISREEFQVRDARMLKRLDTNDDGVVTTEEFEAHQEKMAEKHAEMQSKGAEHFAAADLDGDGMVTQAEAQDAAFARIDADDDGFLSEEEFRNARPDRGHQGRRGHRPI